MSENSNTQPCKSILKKTPSAIEPPSTSTNQGTSGPQCSSQPCPSHLQPNLHAKFDEKNIKETYHPVDKDYGFMKIDEPPTPYNNYQDPVDESNGANQKQNSLDRPTTTPGSLDPNVLSKMLLEKGHELPKSVANLANQTHNLEFESQRKKHYNEFQAIKLAKELMERDEDTASQAGSVSTSNPKGKEANEKK